MAHRADGLNDIFEHDVLIKDRLTTKEGTIQTTPTADGDIVNKKYVDDEIAGVATTGATGSWTAGSGETITVVNGLVTFITSATFLILLETGDVILMENDDRMENG